MAPFVFHVAFKYVRISVNVTEIGRGVGVLDSCWGGWEDGYEIAHVGVRNISMNYPSQTAQLAYCNILHCSRPIKVYSVNGIL